MNRKLHLTLTVAVTLVAIPVLSSVNSVCQDNRQSTPTQIEKFKVTGTVLDEDGQPIENSNVIPLSEFGIPLAEPDAQPATIEKLQQAGYENVAIYCQTDDQGKFSLELPVGKYRIIAQSWLDRPDVERLLDKNGSRLRIDGFIEIEFESELEASEELSIRPVGDGAVKLSTQEASDLLLISTEPLAADPVLGFVALSGKFWSGLLGGTRMSEKEILISGLPESEVQFFSFVNDNNGGIGAVKSTVLSDQVTQAYLPVIAGWSNGHRTPPPELEDLVQYFRDNPKEVGRLNEYREILKKRYIDENESRPNQALQLKLIPHLSEDYELANGEKITLAEAWAAMAYSRMKK